MAHNIMNGTAYVGRFAAWHKLGTVTGQHLSFAQVMQANDGVMDFDIIKAQLCDHLGRTINAWGTFRLNRADVLSGNMAGAVFLGTVGEDYEVIQHAQGFGAVDQLISSVDGAHYETAGALGNGERVWGLADLNMTISVGDDKQVGFLLFTTGHDGSLSYQFRIVVTRVVCANTLGAALSEKTKAKLLVRHTKNAQNRIQDIAGTLASIKNDFRTVEEKLRFLASRKVTRESMVAILDRLYPKPRVADDSPARDSSTRRDNVLSAVLAKYESNDNNTFPEQRGTAYNLLNAITDHTDHERTSRGDNRAESAMFGTGDKLKSQALQVILEGAQGMQEVATVTTYAPAPSPAPSPVRVLPVRFAHVPQSTGNALLDSILEQGVSSN